MATIKMAASTSLSKTALGHTSVYTTKGRLHLPKKLAESVGVDEETKQLFVLYTPDYKVEYEDENGNPQTIIRDQVVAAFLTKAEMLNAYNSDRELEIEAAASLAKTATASGLSDAQLQALLLEA